METNVLFNALGQTLWNKKGTQNMLQNKRDI